MKVAKAERYIAPAVPEAAGIPAGPKSSELTAKGKAEATSGTVSEPASKKEFAQEYPKEETNGTGKAEARASGNGPVSVLVPAPAFPAAASAKETTFAAPVFTSSGTPKNSGAAEEAPASPTIAKASDTAKPAAEQQNSAGPQQLEPVADHTASSSSAGKGGSGSGTAVSTGVISGAAIAGAVISGVAGAIVTGGAAAAAIIAWHALPSGSDRQHAQPSASPAARADNSTSSTPMESSSASHTSEQAMPVTAATVTPVPTIYGSQAASDSERPGIGGVGESQALSTIATLSSHPVSAASVSAPAAPENAAVALVSGTTPLMEHQNVGVSGGTQTLSTIPTLSSHPVSAASASAAAVPAENAAVTRAADSTAPAPVYQPQKLGLSAPLDEALIGNPRVLFTWTGPSGIHGYRIQISRNAAFTKPIIDANTRSAVYKTRTPLEQGRYFWRIKPTTEKAAKTGDGNYDWTTAWTFTVDTTPPENTTGPDFINWGAASTSSTTLLLSLSAKKNTGVVAYFVSENRTQPRADDEGWKTVPPAINFTSEVPFVVGTGDGTKTVYAWFKDALGHVSPSASDSIVLDTVPPKTAITSQPAALTSAGTASFGFSSTKPGSSFECSLDGLPFAHCDNPHTFSGLIDGSHSLAVRSIDSIGNIDPEPASVSWTVDTAPPRSVITAQPRPLTNLVDASFVFSSSKQGSSFQCSLDNGLYADCTSPREYTALAAGQHTFSVKAVDSVGNSEPMPASYTWTIDTSPFQTAITGRPDELSHVSKATFSFESNKADATYQCKIDDREISSCTSPINYTELGNGAHTFSVKAIDAQGNEDTAKPSFSWVVSLPPVSKAPKRFINKGTGYLTYKDEVRVSLAAVSEKGLAGYLISENPEKPDPSDPDWIPVSRAPKKFSREVTFTLSSGKGSKTVYIWFKDVEGNVSDAVSDKIYRFNSRYAIMILVLIQAALLL